MFDLNNLDLYFLDFGLSWTQSKLLSFAVLLFVGIVLCLFFRKFKFKKNYLNLLKSFVVIGLPISLYFIFYPIYEGDIINLGIKVNSTIELKSEKTLSIVVLPDCPFCLETIPLVKKLKKRNPKIEIEYIIAAKPNEIPHGIADKIPKSCSFRLESDLQKLGQITHGAFPTYLISENKNVVLLWRSEHFGTIALDEIESFFK
jgi:thiol-disulfide isomerase/thioredoxin